MAPDIGWQRIPIVNCPLFPVCSANPWRPGPQEALPPPIVKVCIWHPLAGSDTIAEECSIRPQFEFPIPICVPGILSTASDRSPEDPVVISARNLAFKVMAVEVEEFTIIRLVTRLVAVRRILQPCI